MMTAPRFASRVTRHGLPRWGLSSLLAASVVLGSWNVAPAQDEPAGAPAEQPTTQPEGAEPAAPMPDAPAPDAAATPATPDAAAQAPDLKGTVENFWHWGKVARYDLAVGAGQQILGSGADPADVLKAFEEVAASRKDSLEQWLLRWQGVPDMQDVTTQIINLLEQGRRGRAQDASFIEQYIGRLSAGERQYTVNLGHLRTSGEVAVPFMVEWLRNPEKRDHHPAIRRALRDMGKFALNPLVAATEMKDWDALVTIVNVLGDLGYDSAAPYLARLTTDKDAPGTVKAAAAAALQRLGVQGSRGAGAADLFYDQAEKFYYDKNSITADNRFNVGYIWYWSPQGLVKRTSRPPSSTS